MRISLVVVNYRGGREAIENLRFLVTQIPHGENELIVVDNNSDDGSAEQIENEVPGARLIRLMENRGYASGINRGLREAKGDAIVIMNTDVRPMPGSLEALAAAAERNRDFALLGGILSDQTGRRTKDTARELPSVRDILREGFFLPPRRIDLDRKGEGADGTVVPAPAVSGAVMAITRENLTRLDPMDEHYFLYNEDTDWCRRAREKNLMVGVVTNARFIHKRGASTRIDERNPFAARVLSDFHYFCEGEGESPEKIRRLWRIRLLFRAWLYRMDSWFGVLGHKAESGTRAATYRLLARKLKSFQWSTTESGQNCHPSRLISPSPLSRLNRDGQDPKPESERIKVLHLITRLIVGGAQEATVASVARTDPERYESHLWIGPQTGSEGSLIEDARSRGVKPRIIPNLVREIDPWKDVAVIFQLARMMRRERFDIVHTHSSKAGIVGRLAAKLAGIPHITHTVHGWGFHDRMGRVLRTVYVVLEKFMHPFTSPLISVSNRTTRIGLMEGIGRPESYRLIRSGIPLCRFHRNGERREPVRQKLGVAKGEIVIGSVGRLSPQKNPLDFVRVAVRLLEMYPDLRFIYVGDGPLRPDVERAIADAGVGERISLLGLRNDVPDLLQAMDLFILTSLWEGLPRVVLQALTTGVPVISYDIAGTEEAVIEGRNGHLVPRGATDEMVRKLSLLIDNETLRSEMSRRAIEKFDPSFSEDEMVRQLERLYDELVCANPV